MQNPLCCCISSMSPIITLGTTMLSNLQPLTDGCKASWGGLASTVGVDFSKVHPTLPKNPFSPRASGTDTLDSIVTATYHWVPRTLDLSVRVHSCPHCGYTTNRDVAAGQNIRNRGICLIRTVGQTGIESARAASLPGTEATESRQVAKSRILSNQET